MGVLCNDDERKKINNDCNKKQIESSNNNKNSINKYSNHNSSTNDVININFINNKSSSNNSSRSFNSKKSPIFKDNNLNTNSINFYRDKQNRNNNADDILEQLRGEGDIKTRSITASINKNEQNEINYNFIEKNIELSDGEKAGCGQCNINTFCLFKTINRDTFLVYSVKNSKSRYTRIYALNMDNDEKKIIDENKEDTTNNEIKKNRHIPSQCKYYNIEQNEYIIAGYRDSHICVWEINDSEFNKIKNISNDGGLINNICLFKDYKNNEINIIFTEDKCSNINIINLETEQKIVKKNIKNNIFFLDVLYKDNKLYIISGLLNKVVVMINNENKYSEYYNNLNYDNNKNKERGHECVIIYQSKNIETNIKLIDSDCEGKRINIFDFDTTHLLLILDLKNCTPLDINIWNYNNIIVSCLEDIDNNFIKIIKVDLNKKLYNQKIVDLKENENGAEGKIIYCLKGHQNGVLSTKTIYNSKYQLFISIGIDNCLKQWINDIGTSIEFPI